MFNFFRVNTYTVDGLKNMRSSIDQTQERLMARMARRRAEFRDQVTIAMAGRRETISAAQREITELEQL